MGVNTKARSRSLALSLSGTRTITAPETTAPSGDVGLECGDWDQLLLAIDGSANGECDVQIYRRYAGYATSGAPADVWLPGEVIPAMTAKAHQYPLKGAGLVTVETLNCDRIEAKAAVIPAGVTNLYFKWYGLTLTGEPRVSYRNEKAPSSSNFKPLHTTIGHSDFDFVDGGAGNDTLAFTATADRSGALTVGSKYHVWADQDCWVASGGSGVTAVSGDYPLPKNQVREYIPQSGLDYLSAVRIATSGSLYIARANSYIAES